VLGSAVSGCHKYEYRGNWKFQIENADGLYHPPATHESTLGRGGRQFSQHEGDEHDF